MRHDLCHPRGRSEPIIQLARCFSMYCSAHCLKVSVRASSRRFASLAALPGNCPSKLSPSGEHPALPGRDVATRDGRVGVRQPRRAFVGKRGCSAPCMQRAQAGRCGASSSASISSGGKPKKRAISSACWPFARRSRTSACQPSSPRLSERPACSPGSA